MARRRTRPVQSIAKVRESARRAVLAATADRPRTVVDEIAAGVHAVAQEIAPLVKPGSLYWTAPFQYVCEQMAPRVCAAHGLPPERAEDVAGYLLAAMNEYIVAVVGAFDIEHFEAWTAAATSRQSTE